MSVGDQDKRWAPHFIREYCRRTLEGWLRGGKRAMRFAIPHIWREPSDYYINCYFCIADPAKRRKGKNAPPIEYPDIPSSIASAPHIATDLCHSHPQEINLVQQRQALKIPKRKVRHHHHLLCVVHAEWGIKYVPITLIKKTSMILFKG